MGMWVDRAREDVLAARVDHLVRRDVQRLADQGDALALDEDVGDVVVRRGDHAATLDQHRHAALLHVGYEENCRTTGAALQCGSGWNWDRPGLTCRPPSP